MVFLQGRLYNDSLISPALKPRIRNPNFPNSSYRNRSDSKLNPQKDSRRRNRSQPQSTMVVAKSPAMNLVMGQVKILKRGESLNAFNNGVLVENRKQREEEEKHADLVLGSTDRLGPDPETVQKQIRVKEFKVYAGSAVFLASPPPSSVPVPGFLGKKN